jgi:hypothetical protein
MTALDHALFPHIFDSIVDYLPLTSLLTLRTLSHRHRDQADRALARHLVVHRLKISPHGMDGWHPALRLFTAEEPTTELGYDRALDILRSTKVLDVEEMLEARFRKALEYALAGNVLTLLRARRALFPMVLDSEDSDSDLRMELLKCPTRTIAHRNSLEAHPEDGSLLCSATQAMRQKSFKSVHHLNSSELFKRDAVPADFYVGKVAEFVLVLRPPPGRKPVRRVRNLDSMPLVNELVEAMERSKNSRLTIVDAERALPLHYFKLRAGLALADAPQVPLRGASSSHGDRGVQLYSAQWWLTLPPWRPSPGDILYGDYIIEDGDAPATYHRLPFSVSAATWSSEDPTKPSVLSLRSNVVTENGRFGHGFGVPVDTWSSPLADDPIARRHPFEILLRHELLKFMTPASYDRRVSFVTMDEYKQRVGPEVFALETEP